MRINSINIFSNFVQSYKRPDINFNPNFSNSILSPLKQDTVSFSGSAVLEGRNMAYAPSLQTCTAVRNNAKPAAIYLDKKLHEYLDSINDGCGADNQLIRIKTRIKSAGSIMEKTISKFSKTASKEQSNFCKAAISEILNYFELKDGISRETAESAAETVVEDSVSYRKIIPYGREKFFLNEIITELEGWDIIQYRNFSNKTRKKAAEEMAYNLKMQKPEGYFDNASIYNDPASVLGIKHYANDIIGARIILNDSKAAAQKVIDALKKAAEDGVLNITSIENYIPDAKKLPEGEKISDYEYLPARKIRNAAKAVNADYIVQASKSGYIAIHINLDLSGTRFESQKNERNGYQGEIQIIGRNVEELKDVEDLCYKLKDEKSAFPKKYKPFKDYFNKYFKEQEVKDAFNEYTYKLYLAQRKKARTKKNGAFVFPTLKEMGFDKKLPPELDFNNLLKKKQECSINYAKNQAE